MVSVQKLRIISYFCAHKQIKNRSNYGKDPTNLLLDAFIRSANTSP